MSLVSVISRTQKIIIDPFSSAVSVINAGPMGPSGVGAGGSWTYSVSSIHNTTHTVNLIAEDDVRGYLSSNNGLSLPAGLWMVTMTLECVLAPVGTYRIYMDYRFNNISYGVFDAETTKNSISAEHIRRTSSDSIRIPAPGPSIVQFRVRQHSGVGFTIKGRVSVMPIRLG